MRRLNPRHDSPCIGTSVSIRTMSLTGLTLLTRNVLHIILALVSALFNNATRIFEQRPSQVRSLEIVLIPSRQTLDGRGHPTRKTAIVKPARTAVLQQEDVKELC